jgi:hypothetical protein
MRYDKGFERDMTMAMSGASVSSKLTSSELLNRVAYSFTKWGDRTAIFIGGWPVYKYHYKKALKAGKSRIQAQDIAMKEFESATYRSQQSSEVEDLSEFQKRGSVAKLFTMFMTTPKQYNNMVLSGYRNLLKGRGSKAENLKAVIVGQFILPMIFTWVSNGFEWDWEDEIASIFLYPITGMMFFGNIYMGLVQSFTGKDYGKYSIAVMDPFNEIKYVVNKAGKVMLTDDEMTTEDWLKSFLRLTKAFAFLTGLPFYTVKRVASGVIELATEGVEGVGKTAKTLIYGKSQVIDPERNRNWGDPKKGKKKKRVYAN